MKNRKLFGGFRDLWICPVNPSSGKIQEQGIPQSLPSLSYLLRNDALTQTAVWQSHVHRVSALSSILLKNPHNPSALIELAQIYAIEARVTGEHGYYYPTILEMLENVLAQNGLNEKQLLHKAMRTGYANEDLNDLKSKLG